MKPVKRTQEAEGAPNGQRQDSLSIKINSGTQSNIKQHTELVGIHVSVPITNQKKKANKYINEAKGYFFLV